MYQIYAPNLRFYSLSLKNIHTCMSLSVSDGGESLHFQFHRYTVKSSSFSFSRVHIHAYMLTYTCKNTFPYCFEIPQLIPHLIYHFCQLLKKSIFHCFFLIHLSLFCCCIHVIHHNEIYFCISDIKIKCIDNGLIWHDVFMCGSSCKILR